MSINLTAFGIGELFFIFVFYAVLTFRLLPLPLAISCLVAPLTLCYFKLRKIQHFWRNRNIDGPLGNLFVGSLFDLTANINKFDADNFEKYGDPYGAVLSSVPDICTKNVAFIKAVFNENFDAFTDHEELIKFCPEESLFASWLNILKGDDWKRVRRRLTPAFTTAKMRKLLSPIKHCANVLETEFDEYIKQDKEIDLKDLFGKHTMNVIGRAVFALDFNTFDQSHDSPFVTHAKKMLGQNVNPLIAIFIIAFPNVDKLLRYILGWKTTILRDCNDFFTETVTKIVDERIQNPESSTMNIDALQLLINAMDSDETALITDDYHKDADFVSATIQNAQLTKKTVSKKEVIAQMTLFLVAGYDTTATTLQFATYCMANYPEIQQKARFEVMQVLGDNEMLTFDDVSRLAYLKQVVYETLRVFPPVPRTIRTCNRFIRIHDIDFEPGCTFSAQIWHVHHDENNYPEPEKFDPERFSAENKSLRNNGTFLAFGSGPRACIGMRFAELQILTTLAHLLQHFQFLPSEELFEWPVPLDPVGLTRSKKPLMCRLKSLHTN